MGAADGEIDMEALRAKYSRPRDELRAELARAQPAVGGAAAPKGAMADRLNDLVMCSQCQALGIVKRQYGFRVIDEQCEGCDGEGVIRKGLGKLASAELREKVQKVEALIADCEDLDELERLEAALTKKTLKALDEVLNARSGSAGGASSSQDAGDAPSAASAEDALAEAVGSVDVSDGAAPTMSAEELAKKDAEDLAKKQAEAAKKAKEKEELEAKNAARDAELAKSGKRAAGGMHKFDPDEVDVHGGNATADDFMDAFGF